MGVFPYVAHNCGVSTVGGRGGGGQEGNVLFNDALNSFCLGLYGVGHYHHLLHHSNPPNMTTQRETKHAAHTWATLSD